MQKKVVQQTLIPAKTIEWFFSPDHLIFGLFNLLFCLMSQSKTAGYTYLAFLMFSLVYKRRYLTASLLAMAVGLLIDYFLG